MKPEIVLIGPIGSGKTTVAELLSMKTGLPRRSMDEVRWKYFDEIGYDRDLARQKRTEQGFWGLYRYWKPFEAYAVGRLLGSFQECIFDLGGGQTVYEDEELFERIHNLLEPYSHVVLLIPSPHIEESIEILDSRNHYDSDGQREVNAYLVYHHSRYDLAKHIVYTKDKDPDQICNEIIQWVSSKDSQYTRSAR